MSVLRAARVGKSFVKGDACDCCCHPAQTRRNYAHPSLANQTFATELSLT